MSFSPMNWLVRMRSTRLALVVILSLGALIACRAEREITYLNETDAPVQLYIDGRFVDWIDPGESIVRSGRERSREIRAIAADGAVVFDRTFTWDELKALDFMVVIRDS